jgi:hypothetical protein
VESEAKSQNCKLDGEKVRLKRRLDGILRDGNRGLAESSGIGPDNESPDGVFRSASSVVIKDLRTLRMMEQRGDVTRTLSPLLWVAVRLWLDGNGPSGKS